MIQLKRTDSEHPDFVHLVEELDSYLKITDGDEHDFYNQYNNIDALKYVIIAYQNESPVGCGAFKPFDNNTIEIKRMYTSEGSRGKGIATLILKALETWADELNYKKCILETGIRQTEAVSFYKKSEYQIIPNYGQYKNVANSLCFKKML